MRTPDNPVPGLSGCGQVALHKFRKDIFPQQGVQIRCLHRILYYAHVGRYASAAVNCPARAECPVGRRRDRVGQRVSSVSRAIPAFDVRTLNFPARRRMIAGDDQTQGRPVRKQVLPLHQPFSETAAPDDYRAVPVLQRSAHDFAGRCRPFVDQYDKPPFGRKYRIPADGMDDGRDAAAFGRNDPRAFGQEKTGQSDRLINSPPPLPRRSRISSFGRSSSS